MNVRTSRKTMAYIDRVFFISMICFVTVFSVLFVGLWMAFSENQVVTVTITTDETSFSKMGLLKDVYNVLESATDDERMKLAAMLVSQAEIEDRELTNFEKLTLAIIMEMHRLETSVKDYGA